MSPNRDGSKENPFNTVSEAMLYAGKFYGLYIKDLSIKFLEDYNDPYELITLQHQPFHSLIIDGEGFNVILPSIRQYVGRTYMYNCTIEPRANQNYGIRAYGITYLSVSDCTIDCKKFGLQTNSIFRVGDSSILNVHDCAIKNYTSSHGTTIFHALNKGFMYVSNTFTFENMTGNIVNLIYQIDNSVIHVNNINLTGSLPNTKKYDLRRGSFLNLKEVGESILSIATQPGFKDETSIIC